MTRPATGLVGGSRCSVCCTCILVLASVALPAQVRNAHAVAVAAFQQRAKDYIALRDKTKASLAPPKPTESPAEIATRQTSLADAVRAARASARPGDLFTPDIVPILRDAIRLDFERRTPVERAATLQEVPKGLPLKVNEAYPKSIPLATVPARLLNELPRLPDGLQYRFVGRRLILHDTITNLVVDVLDDAVPPK